MKSDKESNIWDTYRNHIPIPTNFTENDDENDYPSNIWDDAWFFDKWSYRVVNPFLQLGQSKALQLEDLLTLSKHDYVKRLIKDLRECYKNARSFYFVPRLMVAMIMAHKFIIIVTIGYTLIETGCVVILPVILYELLNSLSDANSTKADNYKWAAILGGVSVLLTLNHHILFYFSMRLGWNWRSSVTALIYDRLFQLNENMKSTFTTGKLVNLISNDVARYEEFAIFGNFSYFGILGILAILIILIFQLDVASAFAGVGATLLSIPMQVKLAKYFARARGRTAKATDQRVRYISEVIDGIASVKSNGWEKPFYSLIEQYRSEEAKNISTSQKLRAINQGLYYCISPIAAFVTFLVFWLTGNRLTLPIVFSTIALLQTLRTIVGRMWTRAIETGSEALASSARIEAFLSVVDDEIQKQQDAKDAMEPMKRDQLDSSESKANVEKDITSTIDHKDFDSLLVQMQNASFYYGDDESKPTIRNLNFSVRKGELLMIVGSVGSGKSSVLSAILNEIRETSALKTGRYVKPGVKVAYCSQRPWILAASVRANIALAGKQRSKNQNFKQPENIDEELYKRAIECCCIVDDLELWPAYDDTEVGERGISVSGGQKARISLARAVYSAGDLQLLDDPLSAVDAHVGKALFHDCIVNELKCNGKGVVLATHQLQYLKYADRIVVLDNLGEQTFYGTYDELVNRSTEFPYIEISTNISQDIEEDIDQSSFKIGKRMSSVYDLSKRNMFKSVNLSNITEKARDDIMKQQSKRVIIQEEDRVEGQMSSSLFIKYLRSGGIIKGIFVLVFSVLSQALLMITEYWLRFWASESFGPQRDNMYIILFGVLTFLCVFAGFYRAITWFDFTLKASNNLHAVCLWAVMHSPLKFFTANPTGRILNRFSRDMNQTDELFPFTMFDFFQSSLFCLGGVALICVSLPWLILLVPVLLICFYYARKKYICSAREIKRLDAITRSPIYADFSATLEGLVTLRAYGLRNAFTHLFLHEIDVNGQAFFSFLMVSRWLGFRLDSMCTILLIIVAFMAVALKDQVDVGLIGFALVYTMSLSGLFQWTVRQSAEVESQMTSIERIQTYTELPPEPGYAVTLSEYERRLKDPSKIPFSKELLDINSHYHGNLHLKDLTVKYREDLDPVLNQLNVHIQSGEKIGICGRTGSGKSSTLLALLRLNLIVDGDIIIDGESLLQMSLERSRSILSVIPQDPHLFSGTVRFNLDPFQIYTDEEIWNALRDAHIYDYISRDPLGLMAVVEESGKNFSVGQRQLLSLARAILRRTKVLLCDEVTASIDYTTDKLIQATLRSSPAFKSATIITVAHRLRTIADSDKIAVIQAGKLVEYGSPSELLTQENSFFRSLAVESNEFEDIRDIANKVKKVASTSEITISENGM